MEDQKQTGAIETTRAPRKRARGMVLPHDVRTLTTSELLAIVAGEKATVYGSDVRAIAMDGPAAIAQRCNLGPVAARRLAASLELGARIATQAPTAAPILRTSADTARYLLPRHSTHAVEVSACSSLTCDVVSSWN
jgi:hypothetical protein